MAQSVKTKRRGIATLVGTFFFFLLVSALLAALALSLENETTMVTTENEMSNQLNLIRHENFTFSDSPGGVCIDPTNNRLFVEVDNIGSNHIEYADLWTVDTSLSNEPATLYETDFRDSFNPFGQNSSVLVNQPIYLDAGTYDIKLVTTLGIMHTYSGLDVPAGTGDFLGAFVTPGSGGLDDPEGVIFHTDGYLYVSSENSHEILRYNGTSGAFHDIFSDLYPLVAGPSPPITPESDETTICHIPPGNPSKKHTITINNSALSTHVSQHGDTVGACSGSGYADICKKPLGMEFGPDGDLYIASEDKDVVCRVDGTDGSFTDYFVTDGLGGLDEPSDVTFDDNGKLYVSSTNTDEILRYDGTTGAFIDEFVTTGSGNLDQPKFLEFEENHLYVSSLGTDQILRYDNVTGAFVSAYVSSGLGGLNDPEGIRFHNDGKLYVSSEDTNQVLLYNDSGLFNKIFVTAGSGGLNEPADLEFGPDGHLYVASEASNAILKYDMIGIVPGGVASCEGFTCANGCPGSTTGGNNDLYVSSDDTDEVLRYDGTTGAFISIFVTDGLGGLDEPADLVFSPIDDHLYVSSEGTDEILRYDGDTGVFVDAFVTAGSGGLNGPEGLIFHTDDKLYVASEHSHEILRYDSMTGDFVDVFADLNPGGSGSSGGASGGSSGGIDTCKKPLGMEFGPDDNLYVASEDKDVVCRYNGDTGAFIDYFVTDGLGGLDHPNDVTFGPDANLYVTGEDQNKVYRYNGATGAFIDVFSSTGLAKPKFLVFHNSDLYVTSESNDKIIQFDDTTGAFNVNFVEPPDNGGLDSPQGLTFKPDKSTATAPDAPTDLVATAGNTQVSLSWTAPVSNGGVSITDYLVQYRVTSPQGAWTDFSDGVGTSTSATVTGLSNGIEYDFQVAAKNIKGTGDYSTLDSATPAAVVPDAPTNLNATAGLFQVPLSWTAPANNGGASITDYNIHYKLSSAGVWSTFVDGTSTTPSTTVTSLLGGTAYDFKVAAVNSAGAGTNSTTDSVTTFGTPGAPTSLGATAGDTQAILVWTAPTSNGGSAITDYTVEYKLSSSGTWLEFSDGTSTNANATVTSLVNSSPYDFRVAADNAVGTGPYSSIDSATPTAADTAPSVPLSLEATPGAGQVSLSWTVPADDGGQAISDYIVQYKLTSSGTWLTFADGTGTSTSVIVTGLSGSISYDFRVAAVNSIGTGPYTSAVSSTPIVSPTADFKVQRGTFSISSGSLTGTITEGVDFDECTGDCYITMTNTRHWGMGRTSGGGDQNADDFTAWISDDSGLTTTDGDVTFSRYGSSNNNRIAWQIVEYIGEVGGVNEMKVRDAGVCSLTASTDTCTDTAVTVSDSSDIAIAITGVGNNDTNRDDLDHCQFTSQLDGSNQPVFTRSTSSSDDCQISYAVVEWTGSNWSVERVSHVGSSTRVTTESISNIGSLTRGFIFDTQIRLGDNGNTDGLNQQGEQVFLSGTTTVTFSKPVYSTNGWGSQMNEVVYVISNSETTAGKTMIVQREQPTDQRNTSGGEEEVWDRDITALTYASSEAAVFGLSTHSDKDDQDFPSGSINAVFDPANNEVDFYQSDRGEEQDYAYELVELPRSIKGIPGLPTSLGGTPGDTQVALSWTAPSNPGTSAITDYIVQYKLSSSGTWLTFADGTSTSTSATVTGLANLSAYDFRVAAVNSVGTGGYSSSASATPTGGETTPGAPTSLGGTPSSSQVALSWTAPASDGGTAITDYIVQYKLSSSGTWLTFADGTSTSTSATVTGLTGGSSYDFHVAAVNLIGTGIYSSTYTVSTTVSGPTGTPLGDFATGVDQPNGLVYGPDGHLYVASRADHEIRKYDGTTGSFISVFADTNQSGSSSDCKNPQGVTFGPDDNMYVSTGESDKDWICKYNGSTGAFISRFVSSGSGGLDDPEGLVFGPDGHLYVSSAQDNEILKFNGSTGAFMSVFNTSSLIDKPQDLVFDSSGNLYVANKDDDNVVKITSGGTASVFASSSGNSLEKPWGLDFGPDGHLYVTSNEASDNDDGGVLKFDGTTGAFISEIVPYTSNGNLDEPKGLIFDSSGNILVSSKDDDKIEKYD